MTESPSQKNFFFIRPIDLQSLFKYRHILYYLASNYKNIYIMPSNFDFTHLFLANIHFIKPSDAQKYIENSLFYGGSLNDDILNDLDLSNDMIEQYKQKSAIIINHLGLGDLINFCGAVNYISENYDNVFIVTYKKNYHATKTLYLPNPKVNIIDIHTDNDLWNNKEDTWSPMFQTILPYFEKEYRTGIYLNKKKPCIPIPLCFYEELDIPISVRKAHFRVPSTKESKELYAPFANKQYIFVQQKSSTKTLNLIHWDKYKILTLDPNINVYKKGDEYYELAESIVNKPFFEYTELIQNAEEIYTIDSAFGMYAYHLPNVKAKVKKMVERDSEEEMVNYFYN